MGVGACENTSGGDRWLGCACGAHQPMNHFMLKSG